MQAHLRATRAIPALALGLVLLVVRLGAQNPQEHPGQYTQADIAAGARLYSAQCSQCHGPNGDLVAGVDLRRGRFKRAASDEDLARVISSGVPGTGMPPFALQPGEISGVLAFIRAGFDPAGTAVKVGDPGRGRALFDGKARCATCHRVGAEGPRLAPDLSDVGAARTPGSLQRTLLDPTASMIPIDKPVRIVMRDGSTIRGRRLNEDTYSVQLITDREQLISIAKADVREYEVGKTSPMPSYATGLTADELSDVIAYLLTLRGL
jgi:putative heme-binding domain-containing protein